MRDGKTIIEEVPVPQARKGNALVRVSASLVSAGTERMLVEFAEKSLLGKARSRPDLFKQVLDKVKREGILPTLEATFNRLDQPMSLGYSTSGTITAISEGLGDFKVGDRVACAGANHAVHAEYNVIPKNLLAKIPKNVDFESAAFSTLGAIAMHGFRLAHPQLGDSICVLGLGLLGQLTVKDRPGCRMPRFWHRLEPYPRRARPTQWCNRSHQPGCHRRRQPIHHEPRVRFRPDMCRQPQ